MDGHAFSGHFQPMIGLPTRASASCVRGAHANAPQREVQACLMSSRPMLRNVAHASPCAKRCVRQSARTGCGRLRREGTMRRFHSRRHAAQQPDWPQARAAHDMRAASRRAALRPSASIDARHTDKRPAWRGRLAQTDTSARSITSTTASDTHSAWAMAIRVLRLSAYLGCEPCDSCESSSASPPDNPKQS